MGDGQPTLNFASRFILKVHLCCEPSISVPYPCQKLVVVRFSCCCSELLGSQSTGESPEMLVNLGIPWVIIGYSEQRALLNESNGVAYALSQGLKVISCVGETLEQRESGSTMSVVAAQTKAIAEKMTNWDHVVLACEPVWAIGVPRRSQPQLRRRNFIAN